ncbi:uncharacterized protein F4817DRAFT_350107 [Daldinia loculata]|uniref:uncharacterized protein n=1 Tax=Daldinia loculata TaxID=103429 RepID=UPI0020C25243|nr:uncharacterized protein F4817DRAFT_350107 [Daldinia loculata]KAI1643378.1 hypothetical protein F4817DRAFT_350107 [Daldinia loculata]
MCLLISLDSDEVTVVVDGGIEMYTGFLSVGNGQPPIQVAAGFMCPDDPDNEDFSHIDPSLLTSVLTCTACYPPDRPTLADLEQLAYQAVHERTQQTYIQANFSSAEAESDENIRQIIQDMIFNART